MNLVSSIEFYGGGALVVFSMAEASGGGSEWWYAGVVVGLIAMFVGISNSREPIGDRYW